MNHLKNPSRFCALLLALCLLLGCFAAGCAAPAPAAAPAVTDAPAATQAPAAQPEATEAPAADDGMLTITDMAGREVTFPKNPEKVFSSSPASEAWLAALVPERMIGWANKMSPEQLAYYPEAVAEIPLVGGWYGYTEGNAEGIITLAPDVVITAANLVDEQNRLSAVQSADELTTKLGTPVICVSYVLEDAPEVMRLLGEWLGVAERGAELGDYLQKELDKVIETISKVPADQVPTYYYAEDASGLMTESADSFHSAVFAFCGLKCSADVQMSSFMGREEVTLEQVIGWNPQYIFAFTGNALETIRTAPEWMDVQAVKDGHVYRCPSWPQNWFDRSPNPLRVLGCLYTAATVYPDYCTYELDTELQEFFRLLYGRELTTEQVQALYK